MKTRNLCALISSFTLSWFFCGQPQGVSAAPISVETTAYGPMNGFELYGSGLYWWNNGYPGDEVTPARLGQIGVKTLLAGRFLVVRNTSTVFSLQTTSLRAFLQSAGRTDDSVFYFADYGAGIRIHRRPLFGADANYPGIDFSGVAYAEPGSVLVSGSSVFWNARGGAAASTGEVRVKAVDGPAGGGETIIGSGMGQVKKMRVVPVFNADGSFFRSFLYMLNTAGELWRIRLPSIFQPGYSAPSRLAFDVTDFDTRQESEQIFSPLGFHTVNTTRLYATTGANLTASRLSGRVVSFSLTDGTSYTYYDSQDVNLQVTGVALDNGRIFITRTPLRFEGVVGGFGGWVYDSPNAQILRQNFPANRGIIIISPIETIAITQEGGNLRSDGQWLYYTHQSQIRKIKTDSPPLALDYRAIGLEAVQAVQDYNNSVTLVAGKPTTVRAYAQQLQNTTGIGSFPVAGRLRAFRNGTQLAGDAWSYNNPVVDGAADLATIRGNLNRSFLFDLPGEWLEQDGALQLQFTVNPNGTVPETGATPLLNNSASATVNVTHRGTPCLIFTVMSSTYPNYDPNASDSLFGDIIDRALTQLPAPGFRWGIQNGSFSKPVFTFEGIKSRSFTIPADTSWALTLLSALQSLSKDPAGCPDTHWVGMFPSAETNFNGLGEVTGNTLVMRMGADNNGSSAGPRGGFALAHELSHNYGRNHLSTPTNCGSVAAGPFDSYNGSTCTLGGTTDLNVPTTPIGYDYRSGTIILPTSAGDLMSYANTRWTSPQTWLRNLNTIPAAPAPAFAAAAAAAPPDGPVIFVQGLLNTAVPSGLLLPVIQGQPGDFDPAKVASSIAAAADLPASVPYRLRQLDAGGHVLQDVPAITSGFTDEPPEKLKFSQFLSLDPAAVHLQLLNRGQVLAEIAASANPPALALQAPILDEVNGTLALAWTASDPDADPLLFAVQFSPDNGVTWQTLRVHDPSTVFTASTKLLPGGDACRLRVMATDGFHTTMAMTDPFSLARHVPTLVLAGLLDGQRLPYETNLSVRAFAFDAEDGSLDAAGTQWVLDGPQTRSGSGGAFSLKHLAPGLYSLSVSATDTDGNTGVRPVQFEVMPMAVPDTTAPVLDGLCVDAAYALAPSVRLDPGLPEPSVKFVHASGALYVCFNGLPRSDDSTTPADISFYINADGSADSAPQPDDIGFGVDENGMPYKSGGNGVGLVAQLPQGFSVQILQSIGTWSAEFQIPDSLLGGWSHDARIAIGFRQSYCVEIPFVGCVSVPYPTVFWPEHADLSQPGSWSPATFGPLAALANTAPVAVASGPGIVSFSEPQTITLNGAGSYDLEGDALSYSWTQTEGPAVSLNDAASATPSFATSELSVPAKVSFQLTVNDGQADSAPAQVTIALVPVAASAGGGSASKTSVVINGDGSASIQLCWPGAAGDSVVIQASTDLVTWEDIATGTATYLSTVLHLDLEAGVYPQRFYRAVSATAPAPTGRAGTALDFDGTDDFVSVAHTAALDAFPLTIAFWLKTGVADANIRGLITKYADASLNGYGLFLENGRVRGWYFRNPSNYIWDGGHGLDSGFIADDRWHHVVLVIDGTSGRLYRDGSLVSTLPWTGTPGATSTAQPLQFGRYSDYLTVLQGQLDEIAMWNRALTEAQVNQLVPGKLTGDESGLIGFWPLEDGAGEIATDASAQGRDGALLNGPAWVPSSAPLDANPNAGTALRFDGVDDGVEVASVEAINAFPLTVTAWIKTSQNSPGYVSVANKYVAGSGNGYSLHIHNGRLYSFYFRGDGSSYVYAGDPGLDGGFIADGQWHQVAYVVDDAGGRTYVDSVLTASLGWVGTPGPCTTGTPLRFGLYPLGGQVLSFDGRMDDVSLWNRALTTGELNAVRRFSLSGAESGLVGFWPFNDASGTVATDATGHGYDGALQNGPIWVPSDTPINP